MAGTRVTQRSALIEYMKFTSDEDRSIAMSDFRALVSCHRSYFRSGATRSEEWRVSQLAALKAMIEDHAEDFYAALWTDLRRNRIDADLTDVKYIAGEVDHVLAHLRHLRVGRRCLPARVYAWPMRSWAVPG